MMNVALEETSTMSTTLDNPRETVTPPRTATPDELLAMPDGKDYELVDGILVERAMGAHSSMITARLVGFLQIACLPELRAWVFDAECGYRSLGRRHSVRKPDVSVILGERLTANQIPDGWLTIVPDIAAEVVSPNDLADDLERKVEDYLAAGVRLVWVVYPETRIVQVHRRDGTQARLREADTISGEDVLPGFTCLVSTLFPAATEPAS